MANYLIDSIKQKLREKRVNKNFRFYEYMVKDSCANGFKNSVQAKVFLEMKKNFLEALKEKNINGCKEPLLYSHNAVVMKCFFPSNICEKDCYIEVEEYLTNELSMIKAVCKDKFTNKEVACLENDEKLEVYLIGRVSDKGYSFRLVRTVKGKVLINGKEQEKTQITIKDGYEDSHITSYEGNVYDISFKSEEELKRAKHKLRSFNRAVEEFDLAYNNRQEENLDREILK